MRIEVFECGSQQRRQLLVMFLYTAVITAFQFTFKLVAGELLIIMLCSTILYYIQTDQAQMMPTSVRLDPETEALLNQLAQIHRRTKSDILREALRRLAQDEPVKDVDNGLYTLVVDLIGIAQGGPDNLARRHKQAFRDLLASKQQR